MKPTSIFTLSFLLFAFTTNIPLVFSQAVLDTSDNIVTPFSGYYILPAIRGPGGGGVWPGKTGDQTVPVTVLQHYSEVERGEPVKFGKINRSGFVATGEALDILFSEAPEGVNSSKWVVVVDDFPSPWVGIGGAEDHPGKQVLSGKFSIEKHEDYYGYKLVFSPEISAPPGLSYDIVRRNDEKGRRLILVEEGDPNPFRVVFGLASGGDADGIKSIV